MKRFKAVRITAIKLIAGITNVSPVHAIYNATIKTIDYLRGSYVLTRD